MLCINSCRCSTNCVNIPPTGKCGRSRTGSGKRWTSEFDKDEDCLEEGNCLISTSLCIIPDKYIPQNVPTFLPLECMGVAGLAVGRVGLQNFVEDEDCLEEGNCF